MLPKAHLTSHSRMSGSRWVWMISPSWSSGSWWSFLYSSSVYSWFQFSSVTQSCPTLCDPMNHSMPGLPVHHQLPEFTQTHAHQVSDAIQPSHPLSSPSLPASNPSQHQGLFQWVSSSHQVAKVLEFQLQHQSLQCTPRTYLLQDGLVGSPCSPRDSQVFSSTTLQKHQFFGTHLSSQSNSHIHNDHWKNHSLDKTEFCWQSNVSAF